MNNPEIKVGQKYRVVDAPGFGYPKVDNGDILDVIGIDGAGQGRTAGGMLIAPFEIVHGTVELIEDSDEHSQDAPVFSKGQVWEILKDYDDQVGAGSFVWIDSATTAFGGEEAKAYRELTKETLMQLYEYDAAKGRIRKVADSLDEYFFSSPTETSEDVSPAWASSVPYGVKTLAQEAAEAPESIQSGHSAELLWKFIEASPDYNGHKQIEIGEISFECLKEVVESLEDYLECDPDNVASTLEIRLMHNGNLGGKYSGTWGASVYQLDYWSSGEHPCGHVDRLLLGVEIVRGI